MGKQVHRLRHWFQAAWFAVTNGYAKGFIEGKIFTGHTKAVCVPGLNCYSCPGAVGSCPIGSLQAVLDSKKFTFSCYIFGFLMAFGALFGRLICGWMCPFGLVQDLLYKIPIFKKIKNLPGHRFLKWLKYVILVLFVILLPSVIVNVAGMGSPWFCEYICPSGTLLGGIPLVIMNEGLQQAAGFRFAWKVILLIAILVLSVKAFRPFCKYLCPLGAIYGLFNPISFYRFKVDELACIQCGACQNACKMDIKVWEQPNNTECIRCGDCKAACPNHAITSTWEEAGKKCLVHQREESQERKPMLIRIIGILAVAVSVYFISFEWPMFDSCSLYINLEPGYTTIMSMLSWGVIVTASVLGVVAGLFTLIFAKDTTKYRAMEHLRKMVGILVLLACVMSLISADIVYTIMMILEVAKWIAALIVWNILWNISKKKGTKDHE